LNRGMKFLFQPGNQELFKELRKKPFTKEYVDSQQEENN
jgi:hypothetical protein